MIVYSGAVCYAFSFLRVPPTCLVVLLFPPDSCVLGFGAVSYTPSTYFYYSWVDCVLSFFPFWVPILFVPSSVYVDFPWPIIGLLGTLISRDRVSPCSASSSAILSDTSWVMVRLFHLSSHTLMTMSISPSVM
jgi:hypothetical protein